MTIQEYLDSRTTIWAHCHGCHHSQPLDLEALKARLGPDHGVMHDDIVPKLRCSKCKGKQIGITIHPYNKSTSVNPFMQSSNLSRRVKKD